MAYCPKCDMEFREGITICADCGGPLFESEEAARAAQESELLSRSEELSEYMEDQAAREENHLPAALTGHKSELPPSVYIKKEQRYQDLKSSASAFFMVGGLLTLLSIVLWSGIISLPMTGFSKYLMQSVLTIMGVGSLLIAIKSSSSAKGMEPEIQEENRKTKELSEWFLSTYDRQTLDQTILFNHPGLEPEELSLHRFQLIQDYLITSHDLPDQSYVEYLSEEIYGQLYETAE